MEGESGLQVIREVKAFRGRDDTMFGLPFLPAVIFIGITALLFLHYEYWTMGVAFIACVVIPAKALAKKDPYWLELLPRFVFSPKFLAP